MKYWVSGSSPETGAGMGLEVEAASKAAAERDATARGMRVSRVVEMESGLAASRNAVPIDRRSRRGSLLRVAMLVLFFVLAWYYMAPRVRHLIGK